jgi:gliding motility-associated-like protein
MPTKHIGFLSILFLFFCAPLFSQQPVAEESRAVFTFVYDGPSEIYVDSNCVGILDWGHPDNPRVIYDAPPGGFLVSFNLVFISGGFSIGDTIPVGTTVSVRYRASDNQGNAQNFIFTIDFVDSSGPVFDPSTLPPDVTLNCLDDLSPASPLATDNCTDSANLQYTVMQSGSVNECTGGSFERVFTVTDEYGNATSYSQTVTIVQDTIPPVITVFPESDTTYCTAAAGAFQTWITEQLGRLEGTDNSCDFVVFGYDTTGTQQIDQACGAVPVSFFAQDQCGNRAFTTATFTVLDTAAPVLISPATDESATCDQAGNADLFQQWLQDHGGMQVSDDCSVIWTTDPPNVDISSACNTSIEITFIASDACGASVSSTASFTLTDTTAPIINANASNLITACGNQDYLIPVSNWLSNIGNADVEDYCNADSNLIVNYIVNGDTLTLDEALTIFMQDAVMGCEDSVLVGGSFYDNVLGSMEVSFLVSDPCGNSALAGTRSIVLIDIAAPQYTSNALDTLIECNSLDSIELLFLSWYRNRGGMNASDDCGSIVYSADLDEASAWQALQDSIAINCGNTGSIDISFFAEDLCGNIAQGNQTASFTIQDTTPPNILSPVQNQVLLCSAEAKDSLAAWLNQFGFAVIDEACSAVLLDSAVWTADDGQTGTFIPGLGESPDTDSISCSVRIDAIFYVRDACGNQLSTSGFFRIIDNEAPEFISVPDTLQLECGEDGLLSLANVSDNCTDEPVLVYVDDTTRITDPLDCTFYNFTILRVYTVTDLCGNSRQLEQHVIVQDQEAPLFTLPSDVTIQCDQQDSLMITGVPSDTMDACGSPLTLSYEDIIPPLGCSYTIERVWTIADVCGNERSETQMITVTDTLPPIVLEEAMDQVVSCTDSLELEVLFSAWLDSLTATFSDDCGIAGTFLADAGSYDPSNPGTWPGQRTDTLLFGNCTFLGGDTVLIQEYDFVGYDGCDNVAVSTARFVVLDQEAPQIDCPQDLVLPTNSGQCEGLLQLPRINISDRCSDDQFTIQLAIEGVDTIASQQPDTLTYLLPKGIYTVQLEVTDCAGNVATCSFLAEIADQDVPDIVCPSDTAFFLSTAECIDSFLLPLPISYADNCPLADTLEFAYNIWNRVDTNAGLWRQFQNNNVSLVGGSNIIEYILSDEAGNQTSCTFEVKVQDTIPPIAVCQPNTIFANPSGAVFTRIDPMLIDGGSMDNCTIVDRYTVPQSVTCDQAGQQINVTLFVEDEFGNVDSCTTILRIETQVLQPTYELDICDPDTLFLFADAPPPASVYTFSWTGPNGFSSNVRNPVIPNVGPQNSGTYTLQIEGLNGCMAEGNLSVNITDIATPDLSVNNEVNCEGNPVRLLSNSFSGSVRYQWYEGLPPSGTLIEETSEPALDLTPLPGIHDYYVIVVADSCISNPSNPVQVEIITQPKAIVDTSYIEICEGATIQLEGEDQGPGYAYRWTGPNGFFSTLASPPAIMNAQTLNAGTYTLVVITGDCESDPARVEVIVNELPPTPQMAAQDIFCVGEELIFELQSPLDGDTYVFTSPSGNSFTSASPVFNYGPVGSQEAGIWQISVIKNDCPTAVPLEVLVQVEVLPTLNIEAEGSFCEGDSIELSVQNIPGASYSWEGPVSSDTGSVIRFVPESGTYHVTLTSVNGCQTTASRNIEINTPATITALSNSGRDCIEAGTDIQLVPTVFPANDGSYTFVWTGPNGYQSNDSVAQVLNASQDDNGFYQLIVFRDGCASAPDSTELNVTVIPDQPVIEGPQFACEGTDLLLMSSDARPGMQSYTWTTPAGDTMTNTPLLDLQSIDSSFSGTYRVRSSVNGCESPLSDAFILEVKPIPTQPQILGESQYCEGDTLLLFTALTAGLEYRWITPNGDTILADSLQLLNIDNGDIGDYRLISELNDCQSPISAPFTVAIQAIPQAPVISSFDDGICLLDENIELELCIDPASATNGGVYQWFNAQGRQPLGAPSGSLCFTVDSFQSFEDGTNGIFVETIVNGCVSQTSIPVSVDMTLPQNTEANAGIDFALCANEQAELMAVPPTQGSGRWTILEGGADLSDFDSPNPLLFDLTVGENIFEWTLSYDHCINYASDSVLVLFDEAPFAERDEYVTPFNARLEADVLENDLLVGPVRISLTSPPRNGTVQLGNNDITYFPANGFIGLDSFSYTICSVNCPDLCDEATVRVQVGDESLCDIPTIFTPNDDGVNDFYTIQCLSSERFGNNEVTIFNQYGDEVFHARPYQNDWQGTFNGEPLPTGTYYYIVDFGDGSAPQKGFLVLER